MAKGGIGIRAQGMRRYYALLLCNDNKVRLIKALDGEVARVLFRTAQKLRGRHVDATRPRHLCVDVLEDGGALFVVFGQKLDEIRHKTGLNVARAKQHRLFITRDLNQRFGPGALR